MSRPQKSQRWETLPLQGEDTTSAFFVA